jgi:hypothetical protein
VDEKSCNQLVDGSKTCNPPLNGQKLITHVCLDEVRKKKEEGEVMHFEHTSNLITGPQGSQKMGEANLFLLL